MSEQRNELQAYYHDHYGTVYRYSAEHRAFLECGKLIGDETLAQAIDRIFEAPRGAEAQSRPRRAEGPE